MRELGYIEGKNLVVAAELVRSKVDLIIARGTPAAAQRRSSEARSQAISRSNSR
jgi:hypothetical protein